MVLTHDGFLKFCSLSDKYNVDVKPLIENCHETFEKVEKLMRIYNNSKFEDVWFRSVHNYSCVNS
jgi:hypothetical protein